MDLGNAFVKPFIYGNHPFGKFLQGSVDQAVGHLAVEGIGHRTGDGGKGVSIAASGRLLFLHLSKVSYICLCNKELTNTEDKEYWI